MEAALRYRPFSYRVSFNAKPFSPSCTFSRGSPLFRTNATSHVLLNPKLISPNWAQFRLFAKTAEKKTKEDKKPAAPKKKKKEKDAKQLKKEQQKKEADILRAESKREIVTVNSVSVAPKSTAEMFSQTIKELEKKKKDGTEKKWEDLGLRRPRKALGWKRRGPKEAVAVGKTLRCSVKKLNLLAGLIRGLTYKDAITQLKLCKKRIAKAVIRLVDSCRFNAENVHELDPERLIVSEIWTGRSVLIRRVRYHSKGRAGVMQRPRTNLHLVMKELPVGDKRLLSRGQQRQLAYLERLEKLDQNLKPSVPVVAEAVAM